MSAAADLQYGFDEMYLREHGRVYLTGLQALVRIALMQRRLDRHRGLSTAGLVSGYRGSPLGGFDLQLWRAEKHLKSHDVRFEPGLNEDLAATALWGAQMHAAFGATRVDGVFGIWYGKGNGVDRSGDVFRNANAHGTARLGGVLALAGDDHAAQSSMFPHQTDGIFQSVGMPILQPASVPELIEFGLAGLELSRYSGLWVAMKTVTEVVESAGSFDLPTAHPAFVSPAGRPNRTHGLNWDPTIRWPAERAEFERRHVEERLPAAAAWALANGLDRTLAAPRHGAIGLVTVGKAHQDTLEALIALGLSPGELEQRGIALYKVGMSWPLETAGARRFARQCEELLVIEEKRSIVEAQLKDTLFSLPSAERPRVVGKVDESGRPLLPETLEFDPLLIARVLVARLGRRLPEGEARLRALEARASLPDAAPSFNPRKPYFCAGCPHNTSLRTPDAVGAAGGIGCHVMALGEAELNTPTFTQMGGEGLQWVGAAPFVERAHIFQNLGDGTYQHSGLLAIRAARAAGTAVTFKILFNDAVAMTGGQVAEGRPDPIAILRQLRAEGLEHLALVSEAPERWAGHLGELPGVELAHRDALDPVQRRFQQLRGVSAIVYDQTCAAEKRRRRKRREMPEPDTRLFINARVCEACGDCSVQSRCIAVEPLPTDFGTKRQINQSSCNKDYSCVKGFCPSFVQVEGGVLRKPDPAALRAREASLFATLPSPPVAPRPEPYNIYVAGIGGTGVLTIGALLGAAAHLDGRASTVLDYTGLAQKNGAVVSQVRIAATPEALHATRIGPGAVDLLIGADLVVSAAAEALRRLAPDRSHAIVNTDATPTAHIVTDRDAIVPVDLLLARVGERLAAGRLVRLPAKEIAQRLLGDAMYMNVFLLGVAVQLGLVPLSIGALERAIALNGAAVETNTRALHWGRLAALDPAAVRAQAGLEGTAPDAGAGAGEDAPAPLETRIAQLAAELRAYQDEAYAARYLAALDHVRALEASWPDKRGQLSRAVVENLFRVMAIKDEYEVARLYTAPEFRASLEAQFAKHRRLSVWLAPPLLSRPDPVTGRPKKRLFGPWIFPILRVVASLRRWRGSALDAFGHTAERRAERALRDAYLAWIEALPSSESGADHDAALELARVPEAVRGFGPVKAGALSVALQRLARPTGQRPAALAPMETA
jgi:indolepyruvate ferredoxin oxidoreductase